MSGSQARQTSLTSFFTKKAPGSTPVRAPTSQNSPATPSTPTAAATPAQKKLAATSKPGSSPALAAASSAARSVAGPSQPSSLLPSESDSLTKLGQQSSPQTASVPAKRAPEIEPAGSDEEAVGVGRRKRMSIRPAIIDSEESEDERVGRTQAGTKKSKSYSDDEAFSASASESADDDFDALLDDDLDEFLVEDSPPRKSRKVLPKKQPPPTSSPAPYRPSFARSGASGSGQLKTQAEAAKEKEKAKKTKNEEVFSFLVDRRDADGKREGEEGFDPRTLFIPKSAWKDFTPFEIQFWEIKQHHYDTVLFFQKGKFFELYENDAQIGHQQFDLKLTDRVKMKMVGVPESSFDFWAAKFLAQGYKVGRVEQSETALGAEMRKKDAKKSGNSAGKAAPGKDIVRRELKSVLTSGTLVDGSLLQDDLANHCISIKEFTPSSGENPTFGVCTCDAASAEFQLSAFEDDVSRTQLETLIRQLRPKELLHEKGNLSVSTLRILRNSVTLECQWTALKPKTEFLEPDDTRQELLKLFAPSQGGDDDVGMDVDSPAAEAGIPEPIVRMYDQPIAMSALGGMIWYLRQLNLDQDLVTARNFNIYDPLSQGKALILDGQTLAHIEVLQNSQGGIEGTLLELLSRSITPFGKRLFKIWLCAPLRDPADINARLDAVEALIANADFTATFAKMCKGLPDLERLLSRIHAQSVSKDDFLKVMTSFERITKNLANLADLASNFDSQGIPALLRRTPDLTPHLDRVRDLFDGDELLPMPGVNPNYERVSTNLANVEAALEAELADARRRFKSDKIVFRDIGTKDIYQLEVPAKIKVPANWTKMSSTQAVNRYWSPEVERLVKELKEARERKQTVMNDFHHTVYAAFDEDYPVWMLAVKTVAELDCLVGLAKASTSLGEPAVRPEIIESDVAFVDFEELRHPCLQGMAASGAQDFIPNDVALGGPEENMILLTGPNMAGKSTLLRMTCAAVIMAQLGCFVPATRARIAPIDAIYSRMGANDYIFANASTFKVEMDDTNKILQKSTPKSIVILDELGRGTSTFDGMAIAFSVLHRLATHVGCIGFFATHFTSLTEEYAHHPQIRLCNMATHVDDDSKAVIFLYKLINGTAPKSYGGHVAAMAGVPSTVVKRAIAISRDFEQSSKEREQRMRKSESLSLTSQADAAFAAELASMSIEEVKQSFKGDSRQLARTLKTIREAFLAQKRAKEQPHARVEEARGE